MHGTRESWSTRSVPFVAVIGEKHIACPVGGARWLDGLVNSWQVFYSDGGGWWQNACVVVLCCAVLRCLVLYCVSPGLLAPGLRGC